MIDKKVTRNLEATPLPSRRVTEDTSILQKLNRPLCKILTSLWGWNWGSWYSVMSPIMINNKKLPGTWKLFHCPLEEPLKTCLSCWKSLDDANNSSSSSSRVEHLEIVEKNSYIPALGKYLLQSRLV